MLTARPLEPTIARIDSQDSQGRLLMIGSLRSSVLGAFLLALAIPSLQVARADTLKYNGPMYAPYNGSYTFVIDPAGPNNTFSRTVAAGGFSMTNTSTIPQNSFLAWCVDVYGTIQSSASYALKTGAQFFGAGSRVLTGLERLASYAFDHWTTPDNVSSAAFQLAIWEIVNEPTAAYSLSGNEFRVTAGNAAARGLAESWLMAVNTGSYAIDQQVGIWQKGAGSTTQNLAVFAPVPEPETYVLLLAGLGLMVVYARRRQRAATAH
jgi:hypothetical protein